MTWINAPSHSEVKGRGFPGAGTPPIFWSFMAGLGTVMVLVDESFNWILSCVMLRNLTRWLIPGTHWRPGTWPFSHDTYFPTTHGSLFLQIREIFSHSFIKYTFLSLFFSFSPSTTLIIWILVGLLYAMLYAMLYTNPEYCKLASFFNFLFLFLLFWLVDFQYSIF